VLQEPLVNGGPSQSFRNRVRGFDTMSRQTPGSAAIAPIVPPSAQAIMIRDPLS
jgi:hypothetical protein